MRPTILASNAPGIGYNRSVVGDRGCPPEGMGPAKGYHPRGQYPIRVSLHIGLIPGHTQFGKTYQLICCIRPTFRPGAGLWALGSMFLQMPDKSRFIKGLACKRESLIRKQIPASSVKMDTRYDALNNQNLLISISSFRMRPVRDFCSFSQ